MRDLLSKRYVKVTLVNRPPLAWASGRHPSFLVVFSTPLLITSSAVCDVMLDPKNPVNINIEKLCRHLFIAASFSGKVEVGTVN